MKCTNCGASLSDSAKFCPECGTKVVRELFCAECGTKLAAGTKFCPECGTKVGGSAASAPKAAKERYPKDNGSSKWLKIKDGVLTECDREAEGVVIIPEGVTEIGEYAFECCKKITEIVIPASVTEIDSDAFDDCEALCSITVARGNEEYKSVDGVLYSDGGKTLFIYPEGKDDEEFTVPAGVKKIGYSAFFACKALESITLPDGLKEIGDSAFCDCYALESIRIPDGVETIGEEAFAGCKSLESVKLPDGLKEIGDSAFSDCNALESITLPASITKIGEYALSCESLKQVRYEGTTDEWEEVEQGEGWLYETQVKKVRCSDGFGKLSKNAFGKNDKHEEDEDEELDINDSEDDEIDTSDWGKEEIDINDSEDDDDDDWDEEEEEEDEAD